MTAQMTPFFVFSGAKASALDTATLFPNGQGTYTAWTGNEGEIDETGTPDCEDNTADGDDNVASATTVQRESVIIDLSTIPNGSTISSVNVIASYRNGNDAGADDGTFQTFTRLNGTDLDSGVNLVATNNTCTESTQTINVADTVKSGATTLEVGVLKTATDTSEVWVGTIRAVVTYTELPKPELTAVKTNNVGGQATYGQPFTWTIRAQNAGPGVATFTNNQEILRDERSSTGVSAYGVATVTPGGGATGTVNCVASGGGVNATLTCTANGAVTLPVSGYFDIAYTATPNVSGTLTNPTSGGICRVDRNDVVDEVDDSTTNNNCSNNVNVSNIAPAANPALVQSCGLDIALVLDNSTSIDSTELATMKSAMTSFTAAFAGTPTQFSVTKFATTGSVVQAFTANITNVNSAINAIPVGGGSTNWEDGLLKAQGTFDPRSNPNLVVFASDGNPNRVDNGTTVSEAQAVNEAVLVANNIKTATGARIIALGIGNDLDSANLQAVSSADAVITSGFDALAQTLADLAATLCGGTITTTKLVDADGDLSTTNDQTPTANWEFDVNGSPSNPTAKSTDANGQTVAVEVEPGTYSVNETAQNGYQVIGAECSIGQNSIGSWQAGASSVTGIAVSATDIVSCVFINHYNQGTLIVKKVITNDNGGAITDPSNFSFKVGDGSAVAFEADGQNDLTVTAGTYTVTEPTVAGYATSYSNCANVAVVAGGSATCTITNNDIAPTLTLIKLVTNGNGGTEVASAWTLIAQAGIATPVISAQGVAVPNTGGLEAKTAPITVSAGVFYTLSESGPVGYLGSSWSCDGGELKDGAVKLALDTNISCKITNDDIAPKVTITKVVYNTYGGNAEVSDFTLSLGNTVVTSGQEYTSFLAGQYTVTESELAGYELTDVLGDCVWDGGITIQLKVGGKYSCTLTNSQLPNPSISVSKDGPDTAHEGDEIMYYFYVSNDGNVDLTNIDVNDDIAGDATFSYSQGDDDSVLEVGETWVYTVTYVIPADQDENIVNTVTACGDMRLFTLNKLSEIDGPIANGEPDTCGTDSHELDVLHPEVKVVKSGPSTAKAGEKVTYTFTVTNTGDVSLEMLKVLDNITGTGVYVSGDNNLNNVLEVTETWIYKGEYTIPASQTANVVNTVKVCSYEKQQLEYSDNARVNSLIIIDERDSICDDDTHTLTIPAVLGSSTTVKVTPAPVKLVSTGSNQYLAIISGISFVVIVSWLTKKSYEDK